MKIKDLMTEAPVCCTPDTKLDTVAKLMLEHDCGEIPVCDGAKLVGVVTDRDLACRGLTRSVNPLDLTVREVMTVHPYMVVEGTEVDEALDLMARHQIRRLPVTRDGKVVGIVSQADLVEALPPHKSLALLKTISLRTESLVPR